MAFSAAGDMLRRQSVRTLRRNRQGRAGVEACACAEKRTRIIRDTAAAGRRTPAQQLSQVFGSAQKQRRSPSPAPRHSLCPLTRDEIVTPVSHSRTRTSTHRRPRRTLTTAGTTPSGDGHGRTHGGTARGGRIPLRARTETARQVAREKKILRTHTHSCPLPHSPSQRPSRPMISDLPLARALPSRPSSSPLSSPLFAHPRRRAHRAHRQRITTSTGRGGNTN